MDVRDFDFDLPPELIAQEPTPERVAARLLHLDRASGGITHTVVSALPRLLRPGDVVVVNNTRVFPARLMGHRVPSGGAVECLLVRRIPDIEAPHEHAAAADFRREIRTAGADRFNRNSEYWEALVHPGQKLKPGARMIFEGASALHGEILERHFFGRRTIRLWTEGNVTVEQAVDAIGHVPLPPYIRRDDRAEDRERYQTMFARERGSVAAPTAGLHFTRDLVSALADRRVEVVELTLHVGYGTFQPVRVDRVEDHRLEAERYEIGGSAAAAINRALESGRRIVAVGTTTTRTLETVARENSGRILPGSGTTDLFIYPGFEFRVVQGLMTNFHLPRSSLVMLVSAFAGRDHVMAAYKAAIAERYRFYSYGDAMLIT